MNISNPMRLFIFMTILFFLLNIVLCRKECIPRDYGFNGTVCVCNMTYCDNLDLIQKTTSEYITVYESSLSGLRLKETRLTFNQNYQTSDGEYKQNIKIDFNKTYQKIIGFGGTFTDSTGISIESLPNELQTNLISDYFSSTGIEYTLCRVPMAGTDFSKHPYTYADIVNDTELAYFNLTNEDFNYKIPYMKLAANLSPNGLHLFACPWTAPGWMKTTGTINNGYLIGEPGTFYYKIWANYTVKFLDAYRDNGVNFWGLSVQNQPSATIKNIAPFNTMSLTPEQEREFIKKDLGPTLAANGYDINKLKVIIGDDQRPAVPDYGFVSITEWANKIFSDAEAAKYVSGIGFHWYFNAPNNAELLDDIHEKYPQFFILPNEASIGYNEVKYGNWERGELYAVDIIEDLNHYSVGWVDWNMVLDINGGPNWVNNSMDAPIIVNASAQEYYKNPKFYALAHFSKFLTPDSQRIAVTSDKNITNFTTIAFIRPDNGIVVIAVNTNDHSVLLTIENSNNSTVSKEVNAHSIQTYIWWNSEHSGTGHHSLPHFVINVAFNLISMLSFGKLLRFL